jgi:hypothetical protein
VRAGAGVCPALASPVPPPPVHPGPMMSSRYPPTTDPYSTRKWCNDVLAGHPDVFDAVPTPITGRPNGTGAGAGGMGSTTGAGGLSAIEKLTFADKPGAQAKSSASAGRLSSRALCFRALRPGPYAAS